MIIILIAVCLFFDVIYIICKRRNNGIFGLIAKTIASLCFIAIGYLGYKNHNSNFNYFILMGLILDGLGDIFLAFRNIFLKNIMFCIGGISFLFGHIFYIVAQYPIANNYQLQCIICGIVIGVIIMAFLERICRFPRAFKYLGIIYFIIITTMASLSVGIYLTNESVTNLIFMVGAILFMSSDCILAINNFSKKSFWMHPVYSLLYYFAQILISYSLFLI